MVERNGTPIVEIRPTEHKAQTFAELADVIRRHREEHGPVWDEDEDPVGDLMAERERMLELDQERERFLDQIRSDT